MSITEQLNHFREGKHSRKGEECFKRLQKDGEGLLTHLGMTSKATSAFSSFIYLSNIEPYNILGTKLAAGATVLG